MILSLIIGYSFIILYLEYQSILWLPEPGLIYKVNSLPVHAGGCGYLMEEKIKKVLEEKVNPILASHFGGAVLVGVENNVALVRLTGSCSACPSAQYTIEDVVKNIVMGEIKEVEDVVLDTSISEDLLDMAKKILKSHGKAAN